jgi:glycosyltransferase involved in cell wall biosynthesis
MMYQRNGGEPLEQANAILEACDVALCPNEQALPHVRHPVVWMHSDLAGPAAPPVPAAHHDQPPLFPKDPGSVYVGFIGMLSVERIDFDLLHAIFLRFPAYQFIFAGSTSRSSLLARLKNYPNFHYIADAREEVLASIIRQFNVAIVPELNNNYTRDSDGTKILDYAASGVPVLSTIPLNGDTPSDSIHVARSVWEFSYLLERLATIE